ncbi:MAG: hypothetical protein OXG62_14050 [Nitrospinae bacterium]|nr:hypothetical protein [Nitrospinota bacterium]
MWILMYEVYAGYDLLDFALISAILITTGMVCLLLRELRRDDFSHPVSLEKF